VDVSEQLDLAVGETTEIRLPSHVSGGYRWAHEVSSPVVSAEVDDTPRARPDGSGTWDPGYVVLVHGVAPGSARIDFALRRSWEAEPIERRTVFVRVR
jgi:predicted secreted protein